MSVSESEGRASSRHEKTNTADAVKLGWSLSPGVMAWLLSKLVAGALFLTHFNLAALLVYFGPDLWLLGQIIWPAGNGFGPTYSRFRTQQREVWLTIDDGPDPVTSPRVLDLLEKHRARATFFLIGAQVENHPPLVAEMVRRGHEVANHTQTHPALSLWRTGPRGTAREIEGCQLAIEKASGQKPTRFRSPVGIKNVFLHRQLRVRGLDLIAWNVRGFDCNSKADTAVRRIVRKIRPGAIILLHEGKGDLSRIQVIARVLEYLDANHYRAIVPDRATLLD